jgi:hypothetical protein
MCEAELAEVGRLRQAIWRQVDPEAYERQGLSPTNRAVVWIVALSSTLAILETEPTVEEMAPGLFARVEWVFAFLFLAEYLVRLWAEGESPRFRGVQGADSLRAHPRRHRRFNRVLAISRLADPAGHVEFYAVASLPTHENPSPR